MRENKMKYVVMDDGKIGINGSPISQQKIVKILNNYVKLKAAIEIEREEHYKYITCDRNEGEKYRVARNEVDRIANDNL